MVELLEQQLAEREFSQLSRRKTEVVIYYRRPPGGAQGDWIIWYDSQPGKRLHMIAKGFTPLRHFGRIWDGPDHDGDLFRKYGPWGAILSHPEGPAAFPVSQLLSFRWFDKRQVPVPGVYFPQLKNLKITEFVCPECTSRRFQRALHLARHLRNSHDYDRLEVIALGKELGIDFSAEFGGGVIQSYYDDESPPEPELGPEVELVKPKQRKQPA